MSHKYKEGARAKGRVIVTRFNRYGVRIGREVLDNLIPNVGLSGIAAGELPTYVAIGTSTTAPANADTTLGTEYLRKPVLKHIAGSTGVHTTRGVLEVYEAPDVAVKEIGFFGGAATDTSGTGTLLSHVQYDRTHSADSESWQIDRQLTITRA